MALVDINGLYFPPTSFASGNFNISQSTINATGHKYAWIGRVLWADKTVASRSIRRASFLFGSVTKAGGSGLTFSLQNVDTANGGPPRPDETQDQTVAIANGNASFASNTYITTADLSADRSVNYGELIAAVLEYDGSGRLGSDSVQISALSPSNFGEGPSLFTASWVASSVFNGISFDFADGAVGVLDPALPFNSATISTTLNSASTPDEIALKFTPDFACKIDGIWTGAFPATGADYDLVLYQGTTAVQTVSVDANTVSANFVRSLVVPIPETTLAAGTTYYVAIKPTTTNNVTLRYASLSSSAIRDCLPGGAQCSYSSRTDAGSWSDTDTRFPLIGVRISAIDNGAGGAGGLSANPIGGFIG